VFVKKIIMEIESGVKVTIGTISGNYLAEDNLIQANQIPLF